MKDRYDFSKGKRGRVVPPDPEPEGKTRITIRLDQDIVDRFFEMAERSGGSTGYQTLINAALREYLEGRHRGLRTRSGASFARNSSRRRDGGGASVALAGALYMDLEAL